MSITYPKLPSIVLLEFLLPTAVLFSRSTLIFILSPCSLNCLSNCLMNSVSCGDSAANSSNNVLGPLVGFVPRAFFMNFSCFAIAVTCCSSKSRFIFKRERKYAYPLQLTAVLL